MSAFREWLAARRRLRHIRRSMVGNTVEIDPADLKRVDLNISGKGNVVRIGKLRPGEGIVSIGILGSGCEVVIGEKLMVTDELGICIGENHPNLGPLTDCRVCLGPRCSVTKSDMILYNSHTSIEVGENCFIAFGTAFFNTDAHPIFSRQTGQIVNWPSRIRLGNHVWVCTQATILKNTEIPDGCIVGWGAVVSGRFDRQNVAICGNPGRIVTKEGREIEWRAADPAYPRNEGGNVVKEVVK